LWAFRALLNKASSWEATKSLYVLLHLAGKEARTSYDGLAAPDLARALAPDALLLDIGMPRMDGLEVERSTRLDLGLNRALLVDPTPCGRGGLGVVNQTGGFL
jgi:CheY-like chemotaxis protein